ncbi:hypothetical protein HN51_026895 [Arachis hypogaea]|nr:uncharacterized protein LOC112712849 [Arachis hypogaea]QHO33137.1 uncharacterized protein DS421_9g255680 [Arachis hypogaea]
MANFYLGNIIFLLVLLVSVVWKASTVADTDVCKDNISYDDEDCKKGLYLSCTERCKEKYGRKYITGQCVRRFWGSEICQCLYKCPPKKPFFQRFKDKMKKKPPLHKPREIEKQKPIEGEHKQPIEGEHKQPREGEHQKPTEGEHKQPSEGERQKPTEGEGEHQKPSDN